MSSYITLIKDARTTKRREQLRQRRIAKDERAERKRAATDRKSVV